MQRDDARLTTDAVQQHWPKGMVAIKKELATWVKCGRISRKKYKLARNSIDVKWSIKWTFEQDDRSVHESQ